MLKVQNLVKYYDNTQILHEVSFEVNQGEIVGFLGVNGAGKTTTMRIITGYLLPNAGDVIFNGKSLLNDNFFKSENVVGYLAESNPLYKNMRVWQFIQYVKDIKRDTKKNVNKILEHLELLDVMYKPISSLSKGYKQRVGLAQAMIGNPDFLVFDEATSGLDPVQKAQILKYIKKYSKKEGKSVLFSSHILSEVAEIADKIVIIDEGSIKAVGTPEELQSKMKKSAKLVFIKVKADINKVTQAFKDFALIKNVKLEKAGKVNQYSLQIDNKQNKTEDEILEIISRQLAESKIMVLGLETPKLDMKDLFSQITKKAE